MIPNRGLREGADARAVVAEQLEVEGVGNFVFTSPWDLGDPLQEGGQRDVGGGGRGRRRLERSAWGLEWGSRPGLGNRGRDGKRDFGCVHGGLRGSHGAGCSHSLPEHASQVFKVRHLGRGEDCSGEDDGHEGQELWRAGRR